MKFLEDFYLPFGTAILIRGRVDLFHSSTSTFSTRTNGVFIVFRTEFTGNVHIYTDRGHIFIECVHKRNPLECIEVI